MLNALFLRCRSRPSRFPSCIAKNAKNIAKNAKIFAGFALSPSWRGWRAAAGEDSRARERSEKARGERGKRGACFPLVEGWREAPGEDTRNNVIKSIDPEIHPALSALFPRSE